MRDGDAADGLGVVVGLRLSSRLMLKERPHVDAVLQQQTDAAALSLEHDFFDSMIKRRLHRDTKLNKPAAWTVYTVHFSNISNSVAAM